VSLTRPTTDAEVVVGRGGPGGARYRVLRSGPLLALRPTSQGLYLISATASPVGGDQVHLRLVVEPGAHLTVRSAAASVARRGPRGEPSLLEIHASVAEGASLAWAVEPTVLAGGALYHARVCVELADGAKLWWQEVVVRGRSGEPGGCGRVRLALDRAGWPVLRHELRLGDGAPEAASPAGLGGARVVGHLVATVEASSSPPAPWQKRSGARVTVLKTVDPRVVLVQALAGRWSELAEAWEPALAWARGRV
jgi:urease accessory protein